jgi:acrylyl-CoA reductase (NADPH)
MEPFPALLIDRDPGTGAQTLRTATLTLADLMPGEVLVRVAYSTVNYKDGLIVTAEAPIVRRFPMVPGIDFSGTVEDSSDPRWRPGDRVVLNGWGIGEAHYGGYSRFARVSGDWLVRLPDSIDLRAAMAIGTAGYTAMLCLMALTRFGRKPPDGRAVVTGAAGGVGSVAIALLAGRGWQVDAVTGRTAEAAYLTGLGAAGIVDRETLSEPGKGLQDISWAAGIDSVGGRILANILARTAQDGAIAACGVAASRDLPASMLPFIRRGVSLLGIDSVYAPAAERTEAWRLLGEELDLAKLAAMTTEIGMDGIAAVARAIVGGKVRGRVVVEVNA